MVVPKGWSAKTIKLIAPLQRGFDLPTKNIINGKYPVVFSNGIRAFHNEFMVNGPGIITGRSGTIGSLTYTEKNYWPHNTTLWVTDFFGNYPKFIYYLYQTLNWQLYKSGSGVPTLNRNDVHDTKMFLPNDVKEQVDIAEVLSDVESLIVCLEKLIAKKKAIKQGAIQELLTGRKRLPGFSGEWVSINLAEKSKLKARIGWQGLTTAEYLEQGFAYLITGTDFSNGKINWNGCYYVDKRRFSQDPNIQIFNGDVLITKDGTIGKVAYIRDLNYPATLNSGIFVIRPTHNNAYMSEFAYHIMNSFIFEEFLSKLSAGSTINHLYQKDFVGFNFLAPPTLKEQTAIVNILYDMDAEIEQLENKLAKYRLVKQGMMQELLTGRIRLIEPSLQSENATKPKFVPARHNQYYDDAIAISAIVNTFYHDKFPLGRVKVQKLLYLLRRKQHADVSVFKKKAAGPYNETARYKGGEAIAFKSGYIARQSGDKGSKFGRGANIDEALKYVGSMQSNIDWLYEKFKYYNTYKEKNNLEVLATVDMAVSELDKSGKAVSLESVKEVIRSNKEWAPKLKKDCFTDVAISQAIVESRELFG